MASEVLYPGSHLEMNMISSSKSAASPAGRVRRGLVLALVSFVSVFGFSHGLRAQNPAPPAGGPPANSPDAGGDDRAARRANRTPEAMLARLRTALGVTDDGEWSVIVARLTPVMDLQRSAGGGGFRGGFGGFGGGRGGANNPELEALRNAITDNMPDAEIKARLERLREVRKENAAKLEQARADLLAVLTIKQEAVAVMMGLLP